MTRVAARNEHRDGSSLACCLYCLRRTSGHFNIYQRSIIIQGISFYSHCVIHISETEIQNIIQLRSNSIQISSTKYREFKRQKIRRATFHQSGLQLYHKSQELT